MCARRLRSHPTNSLRPGVQAPRVCISQVFSKLRSDLSKWGPTINNDQTMYDSIQRSLRGITGDQVQSWAAYSHYAVDGRTPRPYR